MFVSLRTYTHSLTYVRTCRSELGYPTVVAFFGSSPRTHQGTARRAATLPGSPEQPVLEFALDLRRRPFRKKTFTYVRTYARTAYAVQEPQYTVASSRLVDYQGAMADCTDEDEEEEEEEEEEKEDFIRTVSGEYAQTPDRHHGRKTYKKVRKKRWRDACQRRGVVLFFAFAFFFASGGFSSMSVSSSSWPVHACARNRQQRASDMC